MEKSILYGNIMELKGMTRKSIIAVPEHKVYKVGTFLIEISEGEYVQLEEILNETKEQDRLVLRTYPSSVGDYFVDPVTLIELNEAMMCREDYSDLGFVFDRKKFLKTVMPEEEDAIELLIDEGLEVATEEKNAPKTAYKKYRKSIFDKK